MLASLIGYSDVEENIKMCLFSGRFCIFSKNQ